MSLLSYLLKDVVNPYKGGFGELQVYSVIKDTNGYKQILRNTYIPIGNTLTEIDLIMLHRTYIYVFESKYYSGWIFGSENNRNWTQSLKNQQKYQFYNPILQNNTHIEALSKFLNVSKEKFLSVIVFEGNCELKKVPPNNKSCKIVKLHSLKTCIADVIANSRDNFTFDEIDTMNNILIKQNKNNIDNAKIKEQINNVKSKK